MSVVPINPSSIGNAIPLAVNQSAVPCNLTAMPPEGHAFVPIQVGFADAPAKLIDLGVITPTRKFSKISSIYVDATNSQHDVNILFPDTGYQTRVQFGSTAMLPVLSGQATTKFYVVLDDGNVTNATDIVNVFACNFFVPFSETNIYERAIGYGYSSMFTLQPTFTQSQTFTGNNINVDNTTTTLINNTQWYITALSLYLGYVQSGSGNFVNTLTLYDNGNAIMNFEYVISTTGAQSITQLGGLNFISSGAGVLAARSTNNGGGASSIVLTYNIFGGILVT